MGSPSRDERLVTLIAQALKAGVMVEGMVELTEQGCPQELFPLINGNTHREIFLGF